MILLQVQIPQWPTQINRKVGKCSVVLTFDKCGYSFTMKLKYRILQLILFILWIFLNIQQEKICIL